MIWLEKVDRHLRPRSDAERLSVEGRVVRIGRALDNDLVLDDPHVAAYHAELLQSEDGAWALRDLGSRNGSHLEGDQAEPCRWLSDRAVLRLGQSRVRIRLLADDGVEERVLPSRAQAPWLSVIDRHGWAMTVVLVGVITAFSVASVWLQEFGEPNWAAWVVEPLSALGVLLGWASAWWVASKLLAGDGAFKRHLVLALLGGLLGMLVEPLESFIGFAWASTLVPNHSFVALWLIGACLVCLHLVVMGPRRKAVLMAVVAVCASAGAITQGVIAAHARGNSPAPHFASDVLPQGLRMSTPVGTAQFFEAATEMKDRLDRERTKE